MLHKLRKHLKVGGSSTAFDLDRWFIASRTPELSEDLAKRQGVHVIFVAASFGEMLLADKLGKALSAARPEAKITLSLRDRITTANVMQYQPKQAVCVWPFDFIWPVATWLNRYQPDMVVFAERFRFTTLACASSAYGAKVALINGRCRRRDSWQYALVRPIYRWIFAAFDGMYLQNDGFLQNAKPLAKPSADVRNTGDVKIDLERKTLDAKKDADLRQWLRPEEGLIFAAGSTDNEEEERMVLEAFRLVLAQTPCRLLLAPRRLQRRDEVLALLEKEGFRVSTRTEPAERAEVLYLDTLGELAYAYRYCVAAYVGGAYNAMGHNVMEPVEWGLPVAYGMNRGHFEVLQRLCEEAEVGFRVRGSEDLAAHWLQMIRDAEGRKAIAERGNALLESQRGAFQRTLDGLLHLFDQAKSP